MKFFKRLTTFLTTAILLCIITPVYAITDASAILTNPEIGATTTITFSFRIEGQPLTPSAMIIIRFPSAFNVSNVQISDGKAVLGIDGSIAQVIPLAPNEFGLVRDGTGSDVVDENCRISISNIINPLELGLTDTFLITVFSPTNAGGWAVGGPANPNNPVTPTWVTNQGTVSGTTVAPGVVISESLNLGGKSNHSKFCLMSALKNNHMAAIMGFMLLIIFCGVKVSKEQTQS